MNTIETKNAALCRKDLDSFSFDGSSLQSLVPIGDITWFNVRGITSFWELDTHVSMPGLMSDLLASLARHGLYYCYMLTGTESSVRAYVGITSQYAESLTRVMSSLFPGISITKTDKKAFLSSPSSYGGVITGTPTAKNGEGANGYQIENIFRGMLGKPFTYMIIAKGLSAFASTLADSCLTNEMDITYAQLKQTYFGGAQGNVTAEKIDYKCNEYLENLTLMQTMLQESMACGLWQVSTYFGAKSPVDAQMLGNIIKSSFAGDESRPEPLRATELPKASEAIPCVKIISSPSPAVLDHPLGTLNLDNGRSVGLFSEQFATILNSKQLGVMCQLPTKEFPGYYVDQYVEFDTALRNELLDEDKIALGEIRIAGRGGVEFTSNQYAISKKDLSRHALVIGITGGGKTNTSKSILSKLWVPNDGSRRIPFLVIESAKREYWELRNLSGFEDLQIFTLGDEAQLTSVKYRINPFETLPGVSLQSHIDYLLSTFKAAFELYPPMPYVLETAVYEVYDDFGWDIVENKNMYGLHEYPTIEDLYNKIDIVVKRLGYDSEVQSNVQAALKARIGSLMVGGKGAMLNAKKSVPIGTLLEKPVVMELEDIGDDETKSFVIGILLVQLYEYRKSQMRETRKDFSHLLVVEEAHRLLKNVSAGSEGASTQAKSVEFFCNLLAEIRTYGQGIMIADQIPTKLAADTIKNTNLKIVHRTVASDDRETIGLSMNMTPEQIEYLSSLPRGYAAVYAEGDNRPKCVKMPLVEAYYRKSRAEVVKEMQNKAQFLTHRLEAFAKRHQGCAFCEKRCAFGADVEDSIVRGIPAKRHLINMWRDRNYVPDALERVLSDAYDREILKNRSQFQDICYLGFLLDSDSLLQPGDREMIIAKYLKAHYKKEED